MKTFTKNTVARKSSRDLTNMRNARAASGSVDVAYSVAPNAMPASQEAAPYLGHTRVAGSCSQDELAEDMVKAGCQMNVEEIKRVWNGFGAYLLDKMPEAPRAYDLGFVRVWPVIGGIFPASDAEFDPERNEVYVAATPSATIRNALVGGTPTSTGVAPHAAVIENVQREGQDVKDTIRSGEPFWILGRNLTIGNGDEHAELQLPDDGGTVPVALEAPSDAKGLGQRLVGRLTQPVEACEGATLTVWTHGFDPDASIQNVSSGKLIVLAGEEPPEPTVTAINDGIFHAGGGNVVTGEGMRFADGDPGSHVVIKDGEGQQVDVDIATDAGIPVTETRFGLGINENESLSDGEAYTFEFAMLDADDQPVTVTQTATWHAE